MIATASRTPNDFSWADPSEGSAPLSSLTSLETVETTDDSPVVETGPQRRLHAEHGPARRRIIEALSRSTHPDIERRTARLKACCAYPLLCVREDGAPYLSLQTCKDRLCPFCQRARGVEAALAIAHLVRHMNAPRFLTLTQADKPEPLLVSLNRLADSFRKLRQRPEWKQHVQGGTYAIETTFNVVLGTWHVHLHIVFDGKFWAQSDISALWLAVTKDSKIVDVRLVADAAITSNYIARYIAKPSGLDLWPAAKIIEFAQAMHGRRLMHTFGTLHGRKVTKLDNGVKPKAGECLMSIHKLLGRIGSVCWRTPLIIDYLTRVNRTYARVVGKVWLGLTSSHQPLQPSEQAHLVKLAREINEQDTGQPAAPLISPPRPAEPPPIQSVLFIRHHL
jgi:hypothetical protein